MTRNFNALFTGMTALAFATLSRIAHAADPPTGSRGMGMPNHSGFKANDFHITSDQKSLVSAKLRGMPNVSYRKNGVPHNPTPSDPADSAHFEGGEVDNNGPSSLDMTGPAGGLNLPNLGRVHGWWTWNGAGIGPIIWDLQALYTASTSNGDGTMNGRIDFVNPSSEVAIYHNVQVGLITTDLLRADGQDPGGLPTGSTLLNAGSFALSPGEGFSMDLYNVPENARLGVYNVTQVGSELRWYGTQTHLVPEPASIAALAFGALGIVRRRWLKR
jgi:hypothetical protein